MRRVRKTETLTPPLLNQRLATFYAKAEQKVAAAAKKRKDHTADAKLLQLFKGDFPPSLLKVMAGRGTAEGMGFHQIAMQIAITANALGKKEDAALAACEGLIQNHVSDGSRYNTPVKRRVELQRMIRYIQDNPCYDYSSGALRKLVPAGQPTPDLDGLPESAGAVLGASTPAGEGGEAVPASELCGGVYMTEAGTH